MNGRLRLLTTAIVSLWSIVAVRLIVLQLCQHRDSEARADRQQRYVETIPARHGDILDRHGRLLATTVKVNSCYVDPSCVTSPGGVAAALAEALDLDEAQLAEQLTIQHGRRFLWIKRRLSDEEAERVLALELPPDVCGLREELQRRYPHRHIAAHVLGWRDIEGAGQAGVERSLDERLSGVDGQRTLVRDARGYVLDILEEVAEPPRHGDAVRLTIDLDLQAAAEERLDRVMDRWQARSASAIVLDPRTGEVLAMASRPTFDPNSPAAFPTEAWINRAVSEAYEPGSTLKPLIAAWGLQTGAIRHHDVFDCGQGEYRMGSRVLHDTHPHGRLDVAGILVRSSNIGMAQIGEQMGNERLFAATQAFGLGRRTGVELPAESPGIVRPLERWDHYSTGSIPMGQELAATPLQIIRAHTVMANGGRLITPHLVSAEKGRSSSPGNVMVTRVLESDIARWFVEGPLSQVVTSGTAQRAKLEGVDVFAKTGTAQIYDTASGVYVSDRYVSSCLCGAPAEDPRALVLLTVSEPQSEGEPYGGLVAAPAAAEILQEALVIGVQHPLASERQSLR